MRRFLKILLLILFKKDEKSLYPQCLIHKTYTDEEWAGFMNKPTI